MSRIFRGCAGALSLCIAATALGRPPAEQQDNLLDDRFSIGASLVPSSNNTVLRVDSSTGELGTVLNGESDLGLPKHKLIGTLDVMFRPSERQTIRLDYLFLPLNRGATTTLAKDVLFKDGSYQTGDVVSSELDIRLEGVSYAYSLLKTDTVEAALSLGVDLVEVSAEADVPARLVQQHDERSAPAPLLGLEGTYRISSHWYVQGQWQYLKATVSEVRGDVDFWHVTGLYRLNRNVTFGLGYTSYHVSVDALKTGNTGLFNIKTSGPKLSAAVGF